MRAAALAVLFGLSSSSRAWEMVGIPDPMISEGRVFPFLDMPVGARETALGDAALAFTEGPNSLYANPAALAQPAGPAVSFGLDKWILDSSIHHLSGRTNLGKGGLGLGLSYFRFGSFPLRDNLGQLTGETAQPFALTGALAYGLRLGDILSAGLALRAVEEKLPGDTFGALTAGLGLNLDLASGVLASAQVQNLGSYAGFKLPTSFRVALKNTRRLGPRLRGSAGAALILQPAQGTNWATALEADWAGILALRLAFSDQWLAQELGSNAGLTGGCGFHFGRFGLDYAFVPRGFLGLTHRFTLGMNLGKGEGIANSNGS